MSRHPGNPKWCQTHDHPIVLMSSDEWDQASTDGHLTVEHVLLRLEAMVAYELGNGAEMGYGPDGFLRSLVSDGYVVASNVTVRLNTRDHHPPHVHVEVRGEGNRKLRLSIETGELIDAPPPARLRKKLAMAEEFVAANRAMLLERWSECHPDWLMQ